MPRAAPRRLLLRIAASAAAATAGALAGSLRGVFPGADRAAGRDAPADVTPALIRDAQAHHGFAGHYDFSKPLYVAGRIESSWIGFPHARLSIGPDAGLRLPRARDAYRALEDAEGRAMLSSLRLLRQVGMVDVTLDATMTRALIDDVSALPDKSWTELILYRRVGADEYRHELLAVLVRLADGRMLVGSGAAAGAARQMSLERSR